MPDFSMNPSSLDSVASSQPAWPAVLRALRKARGVTQEGWAAQLGVGRRTVQRWEQGLAAPDAVAEKAIIAYCRERDIFRRYDRGVLAGVTHTPDRLQRLLAEARLQPSATGSAPGPGEIPSAPIASASPQAALPVPLTRLIGREQEIGEISRLLEHARLVTLTGPGGIGKTRLALAVAERVHEQYLDGVWFVDLSPVSDPALVPSAIAQILGVRESEGLPLADALNAVLREKHRLLLLDNFEQVVEAAPLLTDLLVSAPHLTLLITSRVLLRLAGETEYAVPPLPLPDAATTGDLAALAGTPSVALFFHRARAAKPSFTITHENAAVLADICTRLDGLPLALELAAARLRVLSPSGLRDRLDQRLKLLTGGARNVPQRQQTLRDTIAWSYDLLMPHEQTLFRRLSVFAGGYTLEAAEAVCTAEGDLEMEILDGLASLVDKSLLRRQDGPDGEPRFRMLETIREYALEQLVASREYEALQQRHASYFLDLAEREGEAFWRSGTTAALDALTPAQDDLRAVLHWAMHGGDAETGLRLAGVLGWWLYLVRSVSEQRHWADSILRIPAAAARTPARGMALWSAAQAAWTQNDTTALLRYAEEGVSIFRAAGDRRWLARMLPLRQVAWSGNHEAERVMAEESIAIFRERGEQFGLVWALICHGLWLIRAGDLAAAQQANEESLAVARTLPGEPLGWGALLGLARIAHLHGDVVAERTLYEEALPLALAMGAKSNATTATTELGRIALQSGEWQRALSFYTDVLALSRDTGLQRPVGTALLGTAVAVSELGDAATAARLFGALESQWSQDRTRTPRGAYQRLWQQALDAVRAALGPSCFVAAYEAGRALTLDAAVALALERVAPT
jgi:non-specific serine/threonine protein kinase